MKMELTGCPETSAYKIQTPEKNPKERIQHLEQGENFKSIKYQLLTSPHESIERSFRA